MGRMNTPPTITLLTDFGLQDAYVGVMKGVLLRLCPDARLADLTHAVAPQNVRQAAYTLWSAYRYFPLHTVFLVVVDPGVGTSRAPVAVATSHGYFVAPDNGVLGYVLREVDVRQVVRLDNVDYHLHPTSRTFHGRDIFSPAAAYLACGVPITELGTPQDDWQQLAPPILHAEGALLRGEVLHIDHFGNVITSIGRLDWTDAHTLHLSPAFGVRTASALDFSAQYCTVTAGGRALHGVQPTYGAVPVGALTALVGSSGMLEIGVNQGHAAQTLGVALGDPITLTLHAEHTDPARTE